MPYVTFLVDFTKDVDFMAHFGVSKTRSWSGRVGDNFQGEARSPRSTFVAFQTVGIANVCNKKKESS